MVLPVQAWAMKGIWQEQDPADVRLITEMNAVGQLPSLLGGLQIKLAPGWKTYWRSPGEGGLAPALNWDKSENVKSVTLDWPAPERHSAFDIDSFGYEAQVVFPLHIVPENVGKQVKLVLDLDLYVCSTVCVPAHYQNVRLNLRAGAPTQDRVVNTIHRFQKRVPVPAEKTGFNFTKAWVEGGALHVRLATDEPLKDVDLFVENDQKVSFKKPIYARQGEGVYEFALLPSSAEKFAEASWQDRPIEVTLTGVSPAVSAKMVVDSVKASAAAVELSKEGEGLSAPKSLFTVLAIALLGGVILNFMPCVLPVLSLKVMGLLQASALDKGEVRKSFLMSSAGILALFILLALLAVGLRQAGVAVGWGMQFQQPAFLIFLTILLVTFALNMFGLFEISLSHAANNKLSQLVLKYQGSSLGHFLTGAFAALMATPCSAPFVGVALGYALVASSAQTILIFAVMGLGLAFPYIVIAAFPKVAAYLPKPGRWMLHVKMVLGLALIATVVWILMVLSHQITLDAFVVAVIGLVLFSAFVFCAVRFGKTIFYSLSVVVAGGLVLAGAFMPANPVTFSAEVSDGIPFVAFKPEEIAKEVATGKIVFVDVTASWCITCQANKKLVLSQNPTKERLATGENIVVMQADWTQFNPKIAQYLASFNRYGIPFNIVYGPSAPEGILLPEILTHSAVSEALDKAK